MPPHLLLLPRTVSDGSHVLQGATPEELVLGDPRQRLSPTSYSLRHSSGFHRGQLRTTGLPFRPHEVMTLEVSTGGAQSGHGPGRLARGHGLGEGRTLETWSPGLSEQVAHT